MGNRRREATEVRAAVTLNRTKGKTTWFDAAPPKGGRRWCRGSGEKRRSEDFCYGEESLITFYRTVEK